MGTRYNFVKSEDEGIKMETKIQHSYAAALVILFLADFLINSDYSLLSVSLPTISTFFDISVIESSLILIVCSAGLSAFVLPFGKMSKNGRLKRFTIIGSIIVAVTSLICGMCTEYWMLIVFSILQSIGVAMLMSVMPSIIVKLLPSDRKGLGMSVMGVASGVAIIAGPLIGGAISANLHWGWIFYFNIPFCILISIMAIRYLPKDVGVESSKDPTILGSLSVMIMISMILGLLQGSSIFSGLGSIQFIVIIAFVAVICISIYALISSIRRDKDRAILSPQLFKNKEYTTITVAFFLCSIISGGCFYILPYMFQGYWGMDEFESGVYLALSSVSTIVLSLPVGRICDKYGCKWPSAAAPILRALFCIIMIVMAIQKSEAVFLLFPIIVFGASHAFNGTALPTRMVHHATPGCEEEAANIMLAVSPLASALGCAVFASIFGLFSSGSIGSMSQDDLMAGFIPIMCFSIVVLCISLICTLVIKNKVVRKEN